MKAKPSKAKTAAKGGSTKSAAKSTVSKPAPKKAQAPKAVPPKAAAKATPKIAPRVEAKPVAAKKAAAVPTVPRKVTAPVAAVERPAAPARPPAKAPSARPTRAVNRKEFEPYRALLLQKQREMTDAYKTVKGESREQPGDGTEDYIDYAVSSYAKEFLLSLTELDRKLLVQIEDALRRIDRGEYGRCMQCGEPINPRRLAVQPWARHCVRCQELEEQGLLPQYPVSLTEGMDEEGEPEVASDEEVGEGEDRDEEEEEEADLEVENIVLDEEE